MATLQYPGDEVVVAIAVVSEADGACRALLRRRFTQRLRHLGTLLAISLTLRYKA